ncbi:cytoplasmic phenylalanine-tRNA ligase alpha subunit Frs2 [Schizosaccharomyces japonicus yFS275]|uniref:Phenylalanine--tRNA ligase alpha subunit n=1 Tax=Schizosaccharomyces japonicus (strain yFS275 / FY16936) TaxID=402676 RepID=B6K4R4_SCHJY|nr:cytoplasmic phenylalanine-tRNA ligase alpha subunit Frs2 [Schizosaccharomyces japonicus yFS275]EEB08471.1 cytoplasmic phenylalanine-tRNA ligase alpha subunit Frs2 [Schizosaccharomyces japonicus yFS275]
MSRTEALQSLLLHELNDNEIISNTSDLVFEGKKVTLQDAQSAILSLAAKSMIEFERHELDVFVLTQEGELVCKEGSHEARVFQEICQSMNGLTIDELKSKLGNSAGVGQGKAFKMGWIRKEGAKLVKNTDTIVDDTQSKLQKIKDVGKLDDTKALNELKKRKLIEKSKVVYFSVKKGPKFSLTVEKLEADLTSEMLTNGSWKEKKFKDYNFAADGVPPRGGCLHPLMKVREEFRRFFFELGFTEMPTDQFVEIGFWNFDALYVPQQHSARDAQDTFFLKKPAAAEKLRETDYVASVKNTHENGGVSGGIGYRAPWSEEESKKLVLRTHTTAVSSQMLYKLAKDGFKPCKYFSIDRVFRNETVDATHLAEFHQVEGVICDKNLTLGDLIGFMKVFFGKMNARELRFKPTYNPYTEPSLEIYSYHEGLGKWVEIGNSGLFRPEMLSAMGLPEDVRCIGFGLSLERPTMIKYEINDIRQLMGPRVDLELIEASPIVRLDK